MHGAWMYMLLNHMTSIKEIAGQVLESTVRGRRQPQRARTSPTSNSEHFYTHVPA